MDVNLLRPARWVPLTVLAAFVVVGVVSHGVDALRVVAAIVVVLAAVVFQPDRPGRTIVAGLVGVAAAAVVCHASSGNPGWFAIVTIVGWMAWIGAPPVWVTIYLAALAALALEAVADPDRGWLPWLAGCTFAVVACWFVQRERTLAEQLQAAQAGLAERTRVEERNRIAHEIHDAVAHSLTVSVLHIAGARLALDEDVAQARQLLAEAEDLGRLALTEVRQAVGLLRADGGVDGLLPGTGQLTRLVDTVRSTGTRVEFETSGPLDDLPSTTGVVLYRILQEALTNSVRHAPGAPAGCRVDVAPTEVRLLVDTVLSAPPAPAPTGGTGLASMAARAQALGGTCTAGPHGELWRVAAVLPLHRSAGP